MLASTLLSKKRDGYPLSDEEIRFLIEGFCSGEVADYQMSSLAMAICLRGMTPRETATLTRAMLESGDRLPRPTERDDSRPRVDKHSTGGLGDKVSLILAPLLAVCDVDVPMVSGRGLGLTGGTLDKLESIEGFTVDQTPEASAKILNQVGAFIVGASERIAPADRRLYALRDVTGTVESIPLITASILSKKLAANLDALVMDVKTGSGAFMKTPADAAALAKSLVSVGQQAGLPTIALMTDMDQPLGQTIGNAIEVNESVDVLRGQAGEVRDLTIELCAELLVQVQVCETIELARSKLVAAIDNGAAFEKFEQLVAAQGGRLRYPLPIADATPILAKQAGFIASLDCNVIGQSVVALGGGRRKTGDAIDHRVGIRVHHRIGDRVELGDPIATLHCHAGQASDYAGILANSVQISHDPVAKRPLILERFEKNDSDSQRTEA
ncbi:thymidine phosphorylase [Rubripirellula reticaptiva]|uniref:thymidine phosphorylase n=1 Tax=Rubripirellula reticaptiva TaxID=2528013 RepID=A0A5C6EN32_9BACT|nr:thymidine phosphorylase [Rubripirellula reticaptiva]TWU49820.1 Pyrimidine-nucleoside phosphorylase [Rubripirellula reticaptiva]